MIGMISSKIPGNGRDRTSIPARNQVGSTGQQEHAARGSTRDTDTLLPSHVSASRARPAISLADAVQRSLIEMSPLGGNLQSKYKEKKAQKKKKKEDLKNLSDALDMQVDNELASKNILLKAQNELVGPTPVNVPQLLTLPSQTIDRLHYDLGILNSEFAGGTRGFARHLADVAALLAEKLPHTLRTQLQSKLGADPKKEFSKLAACLRQLDRLYEQFVAVGASASTAPLGVPVVNEKTLDNFRKATAVFVRSELELKRDVVLPIAYLGKDGEVGHMTVLYPEGSPHLA